ncbi:MAG: histidine phosphatase family protein [Bacilli bacterium]
MRIYVIRHGETLLNCKGVLQGWLDAFLNEKGKNEARKTGEGLKGIIFKKAFTSPLKRAVETAEIILEASGNTSTPLIVEKRIKEINFGEYEGQVYKNKSGQIENEEIKKFFEDPLKGDGSTKGGESTYQVMARSQTFLKELASINDDNNYLVVTHGFATRAMLNFLYDNPSSFWQNGVPSNCAINIIYAKDNMIYLEEKDISLL